MVDTRKRRGLIFTVFLLMLILTIALCSVDEKRRCLDVEILSTEEPAPFGEYVYRDFSKYLLYNGQRAAVDAQNATIYISQKILPETTVEDLTGSLKLSSSTYWMAFAPDAAFENLAEAVADNHPFLLYVTNGSGKYMQYHVVFTPLPVLRIDGEFYGYDEREREVKQGDMCIWEPVDLDTNRYGCKQSNVLWHVRGGWSSNMEKTPWRLALKKKTGTNKNVSMAGLGADDDWILNPMNLDDTLLKEKLFCGLWNQRAEQVEWNEKMSAGEYVEVVMNQTYMGLFQLQRRIDGKLLNLDTGDVLLKGNANWDAPTAQVAYEIVHSSLPEEDTYSLIENYFAGDDTDLLNLDNFLDVNVFLQSAAALDNTGYKNMYYLLKSGEKDYTMHLLPWDTDMSWGTIWWESGFAYNFEESRQAMALRMEYDWMLELYPDLDQQMARRWFELREDLLTMENVTSILEREQQVLDISGAQKRDLDRWGLFYEGEDSLENLYRSIEARLDFVDAYYSQYLQ